MLPAQFHLDLETLSRKTNAPILSIGACFNEYNFYCEVDQSGYIAQPFYPEPATVDWWEKRGGFQPSVTPKTPFDAIASFAIWMNQYGGKLESFEVWANSPSFDCEMLKYHFAHYNIACPWQYYQERDVRTAKNIARAMRLPIREQDAPHHALRDALQQRDLVASIYHTLAMHAQIVSDNSDDRALNLLPID